jgi:hypothetical protein
MSSTPSQRSGAPIDDLSDAEPLAGWGGSPRTVPVTHAEGSAFARLTGS